MAADVFKIDLSEKFPNLSNAPIVEAIIHWQARAEALWIPDKLKRDLAERLVGYPSQTSQRHFQLVVETLLADSQSNSSTDQQRDWYGYRLATVDKLQIAQFNRDGLVFSRLAPYKDWETFSAEARRLWRVFVELASPSEIQRLGVRFINRIAQASIGNLGDFLRDPPTCPSNLPLDTFVYQSTFAVPARPFGIRVVKMMQAGSAGALQDPGLILDIDVFTDKPMACDEKTLEEHLPEMRWLKDKVFFELLTKTAIGLFGGQQAC